MAMLAVDERSRRSSNCSKLRKIRGRKVFIAASPGWWPSLRADYFTAMRVLKDNTDSERHDCGEVRQDVEVQAGELTVGVEGQQVEAEASQLTLGVEDQADQHAVD